ncbi:MAG: hypothetical protein WC068_11945 [Caulobacter sp.]
MDVDWLIGEIARLVGFLAVAGGVVFAVLKFGGEKLIEHQFNKSLEGVRAEQARSLEQLRFDISASLDRTAKLHQFEFEVLPEAWRRLHVAGGSCHAATRRDIHQIFVESLSDKQLSSLLDDLGIEDIYSRHIRTLSNEERQVAFDKAEKNHRWNIAHRDHAEYYNYLLSHGIFIQKDLLKKLKAIGKLTADAVGEYGNMLNDPTFTGEGSSNARDAFRANWSSMIGDLEADVHSRLWNSRLATIDQRPAV